MIKYVADEVNGDSHLFLIDEENNIKILVAVIFDKAHTRIMLRKLNDYVNPNGKVN